MECYEVCDGPDNDHIYVTFLETNTINTRNTTTKTTSNFKTLEQKSSMNMSMSNHEHGRFKRKTKIVSGFFMIGVFTGCVIAGSAVFFALNSKCNKTQTTWSSWSACSARCGSGKQYRVKQGPETEHFDVRDCEGKPCVIEVNDLTFDMAFDRSTLHLKRFLSDNNKVISNTYSSEIKNSAKGDHHFKKYKGATADVCVQDKGIIYYTVKYDYTIKKTLFTSGLVLEVGLAERNKIDNYHYSGADKVNGWSFVLSKCSNGNKMCIKVMHESKRILQVPVGDVTAGTSAQGEFELLINREKDEFSLFRNGSLFYTFINVKSVVKLCPVFGLYNPESSESTMQIISSSNFTEPVGFCTNTLI